MSIGRMRFPTRILCIVAALAAAPAWGQNINIDVGNFYGTPTAGYGAAAAQPGIWTTVNGGLATAQALSDINGVPTTATFQISLGGDFSFDNALTTGDDQALMDDGVDPGASNTITIAHLSAGTYTVYTYAWAPDSATYITAVNVNATGAQNVGGAWPGTHTLGITYSRHNTIVVPNDGTITITTATVVSFSTVNGIQLVGGANNQGRCCDPGGGCSITTEAGCVAPGVFAGLGTNCAGDPCRGGCCDDVGLCEVTGPADCVAPSLFRGLGTNCAGDPCRGRCCAPGGSCTMTDADGCVAPNTFGGLGTTCAGDPCRGRCCDNDGNCEVTGPADCTPPAVFGALGTTCTGEPCRGRCCHANGTCAVEPIILCNGTATPGLLNCDAVQVFQFNDVNMFMQDNPAQTPSSNVQTIEAPNPIAISDLDVDLNADHAWPGDVLFNLTHTDPDNQTVTVTIYDRPGVPASTFGCATDDFNIILDDEGTGGAIEAICNADPGPSAVSPPNYTPANPLAAFDGMDARGT